MKEIIVQTASDEGSQTIDYGPWFGETRSYPVLDAADAVARAADEHPDELVFPNKGIIMGSIFMRSAASTTASSIVVAFRCDDHGNKTYSASTNAGETTESDGYIFENYELALDPGEYIIAYHKEGYLPVFRMNVIVHENETKYLDNVYLVQGTEENPQTGTITGRVTDAVTGGVISDVAIEIYPGMDNTAGLLPNNWQEHRTTTDRNGRYTFRLQNGIYTLKLSKNGYVTGYENVYCEGDEQTWNIALNPEQESDQYRIVLTWGQTPDDLDSHLRGPLGDGTQFHTYYDDKNASLNGTRIANLDLDDTNGEGPETTTIYVTASGTYRYAVHDYTNRNASSSSALGNSGAAVRVYKGSQLLKTYYVPHQEGTVWNVFEMTDGVITDINTMVYISQPGEVGSRDISRSLTFHQDDK